MASTVFNVPSPGLSIPVLTSPNSLSAKIFHIPFIATTPQFKLHSIVQRSPREGNSAPDDHPDIKHHTEVDTLLADPDLHVVVISTPPDTHFKLIKAALEAGKHVLAEKPLVPTSAEANTLMALAREKKRHLCVYQNRRWDSDFLLVRHLLSEGQLGRVLEFNTHMDRYRAEAPTNWKSTVGIPDGGSALFDLGTHLIDQVYLLFGMPQAVQGRLLSQREARMDFHNPDAVFAQFTYPDGMLVHVRISALSTETDQPRFWAGMGPLEEGFGRDSPGCMRLVLVGNAEAAGQQQAKTLMREVAVPDLQPETYTAFYAAWGKAVESGNEEDVPVKPSQARDVLRLIEAVVESAKSGKDVAIA
ncbi:hypothetical protein E4U44_000505 [Claviceps purpurea]|nr:hypothetical protein E4U44_000505 [Claviceps purpurea]